MISRNSLYFYFSLFVFILFVNNSNFQLWEQDEAAYAGFGLGMIESGNYLIPDFDWNWPHRKPPLHFWLIALSYKIFGINEFAVRFPSVLSIIGTVLISYCYSKRLYNESIAKMVSVVWISVLFLPIYGKISMTDAGLLFFTNLGFYASISLLRTWSIQASILLSIALACGLLYKGPPILILLGGSWFCLLIFQRSKQIYGLIPYFLFGILPFIGWIYLTYRKDGGVFAIWYFDFYILKRAGSQILNGQSGWIGYYMIILALSFIAWLAYFPTWFIEIKNKLLQKEKSHLTWFCIYWIFFGWIWYEFIASKLPSYVFGVFPCLVHGIALLLSKTTSPYKGKNIFWSRLSSFIYILIGFLIIIIGVKIPFSEIHVYRFPIGIMMILYGIFQFFILHKSLDRPYLYHIVLSFSLGLHLITWVFILPKLEPMRSLPRQIAHDVIELNPSEEILFSHDLSMSSIPFYLHKHGIKMQTLVSNRRELDFIDSLNHSKTKIYITNNSCRPFLDSMKHILINPKIGWVSDRGKVDTFFILQKNRE